MQFAIDQCHPYTHFSVYFYQANVIAEWCVIHYNAPMFDLSISKYIFSSQKMHATLDLDLQDRKMNLWQSAFEVTCLIPMA